MSEKALLDGDDGNSNGTMTPIQGSYTHPETEKGLVPSKSGGLWTAIVRNS